MTPGTAVKNLWKFSSYWMVLVTICTAHTKQKLYKLFQKYFRKTEGWFQQKIIVQYQYKTCSSGTRFLHDLRQPTESTDRQTPSRPGSATPTCSEAMLLHPWATALFLNSLKHHIKAKKINSEQKLKLGAVQTPLLCWLWFAQRVLLHLSVLLHCSTAGNTCRWKWIQREDAFQVPQPCIRAATRKRERSCWQRAALEEPSGNCLNSTPANAFNAAARNSGFASSKALCCHRSDGNSGQKTGFVHALHLRAANTAHPKER